MKFLRLVSAACVLSAFTSASAQSPFGGLFEPPRPPASVPGGPSTPSGQQPASTNPRLLPPGPPPGAPAGRIQSEDLPPPTSTAPQAVPRPGVSGTAAAPGTPPPSQRPGAPATGTAGAPGQPAAPVIAAAPADVVTPPPPQPVANPTAVFAGLDKITGRITSFDTAIGETVQFGALQVTARACYTRPPTETPYTDGFVEVDEVTLQGEVKRIFTGWMFAASPGLHAVEHPIYDVWLTDCKGAQSTADAQAAAAALPTPSRPPAATGQRQAPQRAPSQPAVRQTLPPPGLNMAPPSGTLAAPGAARDR